MFQAGADWIYGIAAVMLFGTVALQATPEGTYQKYVRLFLGALLMMAVLSPLFSLFGLSETTRLSFERGVLTSWLSGSGSGQEEWQAAVRQKQENWLGQPLEALAQEYGFACTDYSVEWNEEGDWPQQLTLWVTKRETADPEQSNAKQVDAAQGNTTSEEINQIQSVDSVTIVGQGNSAEAADSQAYYEPSELRQLHQALEIVWDLEEDQILLYWER